MRWVKTLTVVDCHAEGESGQVVVGGVIDVPGETAFDKRVYLETQMDQVRRMILFEPRGGGPPQREYLVAVEPSGRADGIRDPRGN
jgi:proline racemase